MGCVYRLINRLTNMMYIGQTTFSLKKRIDNHLRTVRRGSDKLIRRDLRETSVIFHRLKIGDVFVHEDGDAFLVVAPRIILCLDEATNGNETLYDLDIGELQEVNDLFWKKEQWSHFTFFKTP